MTPEQYTHLVDHLTEIKTTSARIEQKVDSHLDDDDKVHARHETAIADLAVKTNKNATSIARIRGIGAGIGGVFTLLLTYLGVDRLGG